MVRADLNDGLVTLFARLKRMIPAAVHKVARTNETAFWHAYANKAGTV